MSFSKVSWVGFYLTPSHRLNHRGKKKNQQAIAKTFSHYVSSPEMAAQTLPGQTRSQAGAYTRALYLSHIFLKNTSTVLFDQ